MKRVLFLAAAAAALAAGCGSDDAEGPPPADPPEAGTATFESRAIPFTFEYPADLAARTRRRDEVLGQVSVERGGRLNAVKVRQTAGRELETERYLADFRRDFERTVDEVGMREETIGDRPVGVLEFEHAFEGTPFVSVSYFFTGGGGTWQIECISEPEHRERIDEACRLALESLAFDD